MLCFVFAALVVLLDQFIKRWVLLTIPLEARANLIPGIIGLTHVQNPGAAFGIMQNQRWLLTAVAFVMALLLIAILLRYDEGFWGTLGLAAVLGGALGNLVDRLIYGYVIDVFDFEFVKFAIFNVADVFITMGCLTFIIYVIATTIKPERKTSDDFIDNLPSASLARVEEPPLEDEIGLYDFHFDDNSVKSEFPEIDEISEPSSSSIRYTRSEYLPEISFSEQSAIDTDEDLPTDIVYALDVLGELEQELSEMQVDKEIDDLLREYGFEEDTENEF